MLGLVVNKDIDLSSTYVPILRKLGKDNHRELWGIYQESKNESSNKDINSRFALRCLWKALELGDHMSGRYICKQLPKMTEEDIAKTIDIFEKAEGSVPERMSLSLAKFLNVCNKKQLSLKKYLEVAKFNDLNTTSGWESRLESAKLIILEKQGKARNKSLIFSYLQSMPNVTKKKFA
ncbi:hypothetical protein G6F68_013629 [Rhizopus microsporus]|nr:hypothetical protein G6F68_013629 [Rhizopus microsporus]